MSNEQRGCLAAILNLFGVRSSGRTTPGLEKLPYRLRDDFLSPAEASFYRVLKTAVGDRLLVFPKVGLQDLFFVSRQSSDRRSYHNKIDRKHVDFVLCDPDTLKPCVAVELDDASHKRAERAERDAFVDAVFAEAGLPLLRVAARMSYNTQQLEALLYSFLPQNSAPGAAVSKEVEVVTGAVVNNAFAGIPICPTCGIPLVLRTTRDGHHAGEQFYGCHNYPRCREIAPLTG
jgi:very-short-patch-repair endonuclease